MLKYNHVHHLDRFIWQIFKIGCIACLLSLLLWSNETLLAMSKPEPLEVSLTPVTLLVPVPEQPKNKEKFRLILNIEGIEYDPSNSVPYQVYLNLPPEVAPDPNSLYYAGNLALYSFAQGTTYSLEITEVVSNLKTSGLLKDENLAITIVPPKPEKYMTTREIEGVSLRRPAPVLRFQQIKINSTPITNN